MPTITRKRSAVTLAVMAGLLAGAAPASAAPAGTAGTSGLNDALTAARFSLTVDGVEIGQFSELAEPLQSTGDALFLKKLPGKRKPPTITLKRGKSKDMGIFAWHQSVVEGQLAAARRTAP